MMPPRKGMTMLGRDCALMMEPYLMPLKCSWGLVMKYTCRLLSEFFTKCDPNGTSDTSTCSSSSSKAAATVPASPVRMHA
jgi:hypothetical protein